MLHIGTCGPCHWSLVQGELGEADTDRFVEHLRDMAKRRRPRQLAFDITHDMPMPTALQRRRIVEVLSGVRDLGFIAGHALVVSSTVGRGLLTAINWVVRPAFDEKVFSRPEDALPWLVERNPAFDPELFARTIRAAAPEYDALRW